MMQYESGSFIGKYLFPINFAKFKILSIIETFFDVQYTYIIEFTALNNKALCSQYLFTATSTQYTFLCSQSAQSYYIGKESYTMAAVAWYYCAGNSVYYWTKAYDMSATQFAIAVSERIGRTITASDVAQAIRQKEVPIKSVGNIWTCWHVLSNLSLKCWMSTVSNLRCKRFDWYTFLYLLKVFYFSP